MICGSRCLPHVPPRVLPKFIDQFSRVCPFPRSPPAGEPHRGGKRRRRAAGQ
jgi:hypothetical protein